MTMPMIDLTGKAAVVTGGSSGIGLATVELLLEAGAAVALGGRNAEGLAAAEQGLRSRFPGAKLFAATCDVLDAAQMAAFADAVAQALGPIDMLVNNAGILRDAQLVKMTESDFDAVIAVNLKGAFNCTQAVAPIMIEQGSGRIISAASVVGLYGNFGQSNYVASKAGIIGMTKVWARELGRKGICVNAVAPGFISTEMVQSIPQQVIEAMIEKVPLKRMGTPDEVANVYLFLASDDASYVNGTVLSVDGGVVV